MYLKFLIENQRNYTALYLALVTFYYSMLEHFWKISMEDNNASQKHIDIFIVANHLKQQIIRKLKGI